jgi:hypothetical protein
MIFDGDQIVKSRPNENLCKHIFQMSPILKNNIWIYVCLTNLFLFYSNFSVLNTETEYHFMGAGLALLISDGQYSHIRIKNLLILFNPNLKLLRLPVINTMEMLTLHPYVIYYIRWYISSPLQMSVIDENLSPSVMSLKSNCTASLPS